MSNFPFTVNINKLSEAEVPLVWSQSNVISASNGKRKKITAAEISFLANGDELLIHADVDGIVSAGIAESNRILAENIGIIEKIRINSDSSRVGLFVANSDEIWILALEWTLRVNDDDLMTLTSVSHFTTLANDGFSMHFIDQYFIVLNKRHFDVFHGHGGDGSNYSFREIVQGQSLTFVTASDASDRRKSAVLALGFSDGSIVLYDMSYLKRESCRFMGIIDKYDEGRDSDFVDVKYKIIDIRFYDEANRLLVLSDFNVVSIDVKCRSVTSALTFKVMLGFGRIRDDQFAWKRGSEFQYSVKSTDAVSSALELDFQVNEPRFNRQEEEERLQRRPIFIANSALNPNSFLSKTAKSDEKVNKGTKKAKKVTSIYAQNEQKPKRLMFQPQLNHHHRNNKKNKKIRSTETLNGVKKSGFSWKNFDESKEIPDRYFKCRTLFSHNNNNNGGKLRLKFGGSLFAAFDSRLIRIFNQNSNNNKSDWIINQCEKIESVDFSNQGRLLLTCERDEIVRIWDIANRRSIDSTDSKNPNPAMIKSQFYFMDDFILTAARNSLSVHRSSDLKGVKRLKFGHCNSITDFSASNSFYSYLCVIAHSDRSVTVVDFNNPGDNNPVLRLDAAAHNRPVHRILQSKSTELLATLAAGDGVRIWDFRMNPNEPCLRLTWPNESVRLGGSDGDISPDGKYLSVSWNDRVNIYDLRRVGSYVTSIDNEVGVTDVAFNGDVDSLLTATCDGKVNKYDDADR